MSRLGIGSADDETQAFMVRLRSYHNTSAIALKGFRIHSSLKLDVSSPHVDQERQSAFHGSSRPGHVSPVVVLSTLSPGVHVSKVVLEHEDLPPRKGKRTREPTGVGKGYGVSEADAPGCTWAKSALKGSRDVSSAILRLLERIPDEGGTPWRSVVVQRPVSA